MGICRLSSACRPSALFHMVCSAVLPAGQHGTGTSRAASGSGAAQTQHGVTHRSCNADVTCMRSFTRDNICLGSQHAAVCCLLLCIYVCYAHRKECALLSSLICRNSNKFCFLTSACFSGLLHCPSLSALRQISVRCPWVFSTFCPFLLLITSFQLLKLRHFSAVNYEIATLNSVWRRDVMGAQKRF